jgi:coenzyme F420-reducing hydrogenase beta subunit
MINITDKHNCCGCSACYNICPQKCINMQCDDEGFWYPVIDIEECNDCHLCEQVCPIYKNKTARNNPVAYACKNKDEIIRKQSSSGGIFSLMAEKVLEDNGVVFGAGYNTDFDVEHSWIDNIEGLSRLRGSKYVQSNIGNAYQEAKRFLIKGRQVLFSGTPCQIAGLKAFLGKDYKLLICVDIVCHGVPSPKVWQLYKQHMEKVFKAESMKINFRSKVSGWRLFSMLFVFNNGTEYSKTLTEDIFMQGFLKNLYLRPSCYACRFKTLNRLSDITLADFWGIEGMLPQMDDDLGTSFVLVHSQKGQEMFSTMAKRMDYEQVDVEKAIAKNSAAIKSVVLNPKRKKFFIELPGTNDINELILKYTKDSFPRSLYVEARRLIARVKRKVMNEHVN